MVKFLKRKYSNFKVAAAYKNENVFILFFKRIFGYTVSNVLLMIDLLFSVIVLPLAIPFVFVARTKKKQRIVFFIGLEHIINKTAERALGYTERSYRPVFFSLENTGKSHRVSGVQNHVIRYTFSIALDTIAFAYFLIKFRPAIVETYFEGRLWRQLFAGILTKVSKSSLVYIERGLWYYIKDHNTTFLQRKNIQWLFALPDLVLFREHGTLEVYAELQVNTAVFNFDHNRVRIKDEPVFSDKKNIKAALYLNSFKTFRRVDLFVKAIPEILKYHPDAEFIIVGAQNAGDLNYIKKLLTELGLENHPNISVNMWTDDPAAYYERSNVFVLPATLVYCNYSLLEAMERGLAAISSKVDDADKIITSGQDGILCELDDQIIAVNIIKLFDDAGFRDSIAKNGRQKMKDVYNDENRLDIIMEIADTHF